jgi:hypothetical protein
MGEAQLTHWVMLVPARAACPVAVSIGAATVVPHPGQKRSPVVIALPHVLHETVFDMPYANPPGRPSREPEKCS